MSGERDIDVFSDVIDAEAARRRRGRGARGPWTAGRDRRQPVRRAAATGLGPDLWELELHPVRNLDALGHHVAALEGRAAEPNVFFTLPLLQAAFPRLARMRTGAMGPIHLLCLWLTRAEEGEDRRRLALFMPLAVPTLGWPGRAAAMAASSEWTPIGTPLVDRDVLPEAAEHALRLLADPSLLLPGALVMPDARADGPVARAFEAAAGSLGLRHHAVQRRTRATHTVGQPTALSRRRERDHARQLRRLGEAGRLEIAEARDEGDVLDAFEAFMVLELRSWKGRRGSALYNLRHIAAFSRQTVSALAREGACTVHSLKLDGETVAALIVLGCERTGLHTWKTAFDPRVHAASPGVQAVLAATRAMERRYPPGIRIDSLAVEDHPVMDRVWRGRMAMATHVIALRSDGANEADALARAIARRDRWREGAKRLQRLLGLRADR